MAKTLSELMEAAERYLDERGYAESSRRFYRRGWSEFEGWCAWRGLLPSPSREDAAAFIHEMGWDVPARYLDRQLARAVRCLFDLEATGAFPRAYGRCRILVPDGLRDAYEAYESHLGTLGLRQRTVYSKMHRVKLFLAFLGGAGVTDIRRLSTGDVEAFLPHAGEASSSRSGNLYELRAFLRFCVGTLGCDPSLASLFPTILANAEDVLPSAFRAEEVRGILSQVAEAEGPRQLRERAMYLLAWQCALRVSDIRGLLASDIDWVSRSISLVQSKTGARVDLPMTEECALAIAAYLRDGRPASDDPHVFLTPLAPHLPYSQYNSFWAPTNERVESAGIDVGGRHHGMHALRHGAAVRMLETGATYPEVGAVLGHASTNVTRRYLRVDAEALRPLCLEVPDARR